VTIGGLTFTFVTEGVERAVALAKTAAGDKNVSLLARLYPFAGTEKAG
jgi:hypothetical protein